MLNEACCSGDSPLNAAESTKRPKARTPTALTITPRATLPANATRRIRLRHCSFAAQTLASSISASASAFPSLMAFRKCLIR